MAGIDKITGEILRDAQDKANRILAEAKDQADEIMSQSRAQAEAIRAQAEEKSAREVLNYETRIRSQADMKKRQTLLAAKQDWIRSVIAEAYDRLSSQDTEAYFDMLAKILKKTVRSGEGEILLSGRDRESMPESFVREISQIAGQAGGSLTLARTDADIENGFLLRYGGIEENCSLRAVFDDKMEALQDRVHELMR